jgi:DNA polymerase-3 subunit beta
MKLSANREVLLAPLQAVIGVVERRQTMPILANMLIVARKGVVSVTATDLEVELVASTEVDVEEEGEITLPGRKLLDICKALPEGAKVSLSVLADKATIRSGKSRFTLSTLPAAEFPTIEEMNIQQKLTIPQEAIRGLLQKTHFSMAQQDVRYYLNGLLLEVEDKTLRAVATDGHRLALSEVNFDSDGSKKGLQVIVPRKGVLELQRLLGSDADVLLSIGSNHIRVELDGIRFTSKLIDGRFPEYGRVIPQGASQIMVADRGALRAAMQRTAILSNEKYRGIRLELRQGLLTMQAHNPEQEEAEEEVEVNYEGGDIEIGFNVNYLLDALGAVEGDEVQVTLGDSNSSCVISEAGGGRSKYVVMPMRL